MYCISTIHPAAILHGGRPINDFIGADLAKAWRVANEGPKLEEHILPVIPGGNPSMGLTQMMDTATKWLQHWYHNAKVIAVDVETSGLEYFNCKLYSIALADPETKTAIAFTLMDFHTLPISYENALIAWVRAILANPDIPKAYHNSPFDRAVLSRKGFRISGNTLDTLALGHLIQPDAPKDLGWYGHTFLDVEPWKLDHESGKMANTKDPVSLLVYNAKDALYTGLLIEPMIGTILTRGMSQNLISWQMSFADLATAMELRGLPINFEKRRAMGQEIQNEMEEALVWMRDWLSWPDFNPMSQAHRTEAIYGLKYSTNPWNLGLKPTKLTKKTQAPSTSYKAMIDYYEHPFIRHLATYIENRHTFSTIYREEMIVGYKKVNGKKVKKIKAGSYQKAMCEDGRMHPKWNPTGQVGSRFSSNPNVQNIAGRHRGFIEAPDGKVFISGDKNQLELRLMAVVAGVSELLEEMNRPGGDPHTLAAANIYGEEFLNQPPAKRKIIRAITKNVVYASIYLAGVTTVWRTCRE
jgi:DNA polymerase-1